MGFTEEMNHSHLTQVFESGSSGDPLDEILTLLSSIAPSYSQESLRQLHQEIADFFAGDHSEYRPSNTKYHNLGHTYSVVLATTRLFHGLSCEERHVSEETLKKALYCAYFHDCGLLLRNSENATTGAAYTKEHEERSILFMKRYLQEREFPPSFITDCSFIIQCTNLKVDPDTLAFPSEEIKLAGFVVGSADILAQMADRYYLERLPFLFQEHKEGGITIHNSAVELMQHTTFFYHHVIIDRLERVFFNIAEAMRTHFRERWNLDRNLYMENIDNNIKYIKTVALSCEDELECLQQFLRRKPPF
ncbi:MAG: hypothetical protein KKD01_07545 [Proteobacteria bacterium]|nr:hypothetical protein [Pseudomonadota bacterium]MBU1420740.1 hypothetical protein [Pseudomonadota bacterium]MBU1454570.1 hypothetical protein [Pseudomonadota bacterium]